MKASNEEIEPSNLQEKIQENAALITQNPDYHRLVDKKFSEEHPFSQYTAVIFETKKDIINSKMINGKEVLISQNGSNSDFSTHSSKEVLINSLDKEKGDKIKNAFGHSAFEISQSFESNMIECVAFTGTV